MVAAARAALLAAALASALALPPRRPGADQDGVAERLERLERGLLPVPAPPASRDAPAQTLPARAARVQELVRSGHGQVGRWFRDLVPLVECAGEPACTAGALAQVTRKSDLWTLPGMESLVELVRGNATWFAGRVACAAPTVAAFQEALEALPGPAPRIALVPGGRAPLRAAGRPWITISPRAAEALGRVGELLTAPMAALEAKGNLTLALEVDVDDAWFLAGRPSADVSAVHLVGEGRIIVNPRHAAKLRAIAAAGAAGNPMLSDSYDAISRALAAPAASSGHITDPRQLQQSADAALLDILLSVVSATVGDQGLELPWKCFVCVVTLSMLLPLATNLALQGLVSIYCAVAKLPPDDCIYIRYDMIAFALLITPLEVYPIAEVCVLQHGCH